MRIEGGEPSGAALAFGDEPSRDALLEPGLFSVAAAARPRKGAAKRRPDWHGPLSHGVEMGHFLSRT
jgi:hypothetical protein